MVNVEDREVDAIQREIAERRRDLAESVAELRNVATEMVDVKKRLREVAARSVTETSLAIRRATRRATSAAVDRPVLAGLGVAFLGALLVYVSAKRREAPPREPFFASLRDEIQKRAGW